MDGKLVAFAPSGLTTYTIPDGVTSIEPWGFCNCSNLTSIIIPNGVTTIGKSAFNSCSKLTSITLPQSLETIESGAFYKCLKLKSITIPKNVTTIGDNAFNECRGLISVYCQSTVPPILSYDVFWSYPTPHSIYVPQASIEAYKSASGWSKYAGKIVGYDF